jgi:hypothetical protein
MDMPAPKPERPSRMACRTHTQACKQLIGVHVTAPWLLNQLVANNCLWPLFGAQQMGSVSADTEV